MKQITTCIKSNEWILWEGNAYIAQILHSFIGRDKIHSKCECNYGKRRLTKVVLVYLPISAGVLWQKLRLNFYNKPNDNWDDWTHSCSPFHLLPKLLSYLLWLSYEKQDLKHYRTQCFNKYQILKGARK